MGNATRATLAQPRILPIWRRKAKGPQMEAVASLVAIVLSIILVTSAIALLRPLPRLGLPTRQRAGIVLIASFMAAGFLLPKPPVQETRACASDDLNCLANKYLARAHTTCNAFMRSYWRSYPKWREIGQRNGRLIFSDWTWIDRNEKHGILYFGNEILIDGKAFETQEPFTCRYGFFNNTGYFDFN